MHLVEVEILGGDLVRTNIASVLGWAVMPSLLKNVGGFLEAETLCGSFCIVTALVSQ